MHSNYIKPLSSILNFRKTIYNQYWQIVTWALLILVFGSFILGVIQGAVALILSLAIVMILVLKPVHEILTTDFDIVPKNKEANIQDELWD